MVLEQSKITEEGLRELRSRIGSYYEFKYGNKEVTRDSIREFATGMGDANPLWLEEEYAKESRWKGLIAPPTYLYTVIYATGLRVGGLRGVGAFHSGNFWEWYRPIRLGDLITGTYRCYDVVEKPSKFGGRHINVYAEIKYYNQDDELVANAIGWSIRIERGASRKKGKYSSFKPYKYSAEELESIYDAIEHVVIRGKEPRYWDDVDVGDELPQVVKGPFSPWELVAWKTGWHLPLWGMGKANELRLRDLLKHPAFSFRDASGAIQTAEAAHVDSKVAKSTAVPSGYDFGAQRNSWMSQVVTNWMGDSGFLKKLEASYRRCNLFGDTQFIKGKVTKKYLEGSEYLVDLEVWCENQRQEVTAPGTATVALPTKGKSGSPSKE
jgi:acyl dehydratase